MNTHFKHLAIVAALCGFAVVMPVCTTRAMNVGDYPTATQMVSIHPPGPEADPYLQHYHGTVSFQYAGRYWREFLLAEGNSTQASLYPPGPEADPYLQHYQGTISSRYSTPEKLMASNQSQSAP